MAVTIKRRTIKVRRKRQPGAPQDEPSFTGILPDGTVEFTTEADVKGKTDEARCRGIMHVHDFDVVGEVDGDGQVTFKGKTGAASAGEDHTHDVDALMSDSDQTEYEFETGEASNGDGHMHLIRVELEEPLGPQDSAGEEEEQEEGEVEDDSPKPSAKKSSKKTNASRPDSEAAQFSEWDMSAPKQIRYRLRNPNDFRPGTFRTIKMSGMKGISIIAGKLKKDKVPDGTNAGSTIAQSLRFDKEQWTLQEAKAWYEKNKDQFGQPDPNEEMRALLRRMKALVEHRKESFMGRAPAIISSRGESIPGMDEGWFNNLSSTPQTKQGGLIFSDGAGFVGFVDENDPRRRFDGFSTDFSFSAPLDDIPNIFRTGKPRVTLRDGFLYHEVTRTGKWVHPYYGEVDIDHDKLLDFVKHFDMGVLRQMACFNIDHEYNHGSVGWLAKLEVTPGKFTYVGEDRKRVEYDGHVLGSYTKLSPFGEDEIVDKGKWSYTSAEIAWKFREPEMFASEECDRCKKDKDEEDDDESDPMAKYFGRVMHKNVIVGAAATNRPFISNLKAFAASRPRIQMSHRNSKILDVYRRVMSDCGHNILEAHSAVLSELRRRGLV